jgi:hypothetical protein
MLVQADAVTAQPVNSTFNFEGEPLSPEPENYYTNKTEVTGELMANQKRLLTKKFQGKHASKAFPHLVGAFASMAMGKDTVSGAGPYVHKIEIDKTKVELPYRTVVENDGDTQVRFVGVACAGFMLKGQRGGFVEFEADLLGRGDEAADATAKPARLAETYMAYGDMTMVKGGTFDGTTVTGGSNISAELVEFSLAFKNNAKAVVQFGDSSGYAARVQRGQSYDVEFSCKLEFASAVHRNDWLAQNEFVIELPLTSSAIQKIQIVLPRCFFENAKKTVADGILTLDCKIGVLADAVHGPFTMFITTSHAANYLAAA